jgi:hypothetical protein
MVPIVLPRTSNMLPIRLPNSLSPSYLRLAVPLEHSKKFIAHHDPGCGRLREASAPAPRGEHMSHHPQSTVPDAPENGLERLVELACQASPVDRLRLERTIRIILEARQTVSNARQNQQNGPAPTVTLVANSEAGDRCEFRDLSRRYSCSQNAIKSIVLNARWDGWGNSPPVSTVVS